ncbi:hypothetical protein [Nocardiopsis sp. L17-MgMaSL7]|uniref:hypothetical protein n=1 Tax=Nocardiopsis sp. L17-MgMaSL7 TaxID=1938893 RepID=UPI000D70F18B|nr:hypothetical protein [Nocardiopsis sp. L17-MgMaSL7]PWV51267.1 hypothetical protein BDW27_107340 [Nocardiopsis sp. L17-MgMaSL7]
MIVPLFADAEDLVVDHLRARLPDFPDRWSGTPVTAVSAPGWEPGEDPALTVHCESAESEPSFTQRAAVRVTSWADARDDVKELARLAHAALLEHPGDAEVVSVRPVDGVVVDDEGDLADHRASFTVLVTQRRAARP